jgi:hypothetical protein
MAIDRQRRPVPVVRRPRTGRAALTAGALLAVALGLAACGSSSSSSTTTTRPATTTTTTKPSGTTTTTKPSGSTTTTKPSGTGCATSALTVTVGNPNGTAGAVHYTVTFHNAGPSSCTLGGYPGVSFLATGGSQIGVPAERAGGGTVTTVTLAPGGDAYSSVAVTDPGIPPCTSQATAAQIRIYPPGQTQAAVVAAPSGLAVCTSPNTTSYTSSTVTPVSATQL